jgi:hypothetical protein
LPNRGALVHLDAPPPPLVENVSQRLHIRLRSGSFGVAYGLNSAALRREKIPAADNRLPAVTMAKAAIASDAQFFLDSQP